MGIRPMCRGGPGGRFWHGRIERGGRSKGRRGRWIKRRLLLNLCPKGRGRGRGGQREECEESWLLNGA